MSDVLLECREIGKVFRGVRALDGVGSRRDQRDRGATRRHRAACGRDTDSSGADGRYADDRDFAALDQRSHDALAVASQRPLLADAMERLHSHLHVFRLRSVRSADDPTLPEHERVGRAILRRKPDRAAEAMAEHLTRSLRRQLSDDPKS